MAGGRLNSMILESNWDEVPIGAEDAWKTSAGGAVFFGVGAVVLLVVGSGKEGKPYVL